MIGLLVGKRRFLSCPGGTCWLYRIGSAGSGRRRSGSSRGGGGEWWCGSTELDGAVSEGEVWWLSANMRGKILGRKEKGKGNKLA